MPFAKNMFYIKSLKFAFEMNFSLTCFLILSLFSITFIATTQPSVTELSLSPTSYIAAVGSLEGGTLVYIKGSGFGINISLNVVEIGPYPCVI